MTDFVYDSFTGSGTLATHVGETGADWAAAGATPLGVNLGAGAFLNLGVVDNGLTTDTSFSFLSSGVCPGARAFVEVTMVPGATADPYEDMRVDMALTDGALGGTISDGQLFFQVRFAIGEIDAWLTTQAIADQAYGTAGALGSATPLDAYPVWGSPLTIRAELLADEARLLFNDTVVGTCPRVNWPTPHSALDLQAVYRMVYTVPGTVVTSVRAGGINPPSAFWTSNVGATEILT